MTNPDKPGLRSDEIRMTNKELVVWMILVIERMDSAFTQELQ